MLTYLRALRRDKSGVSLIEYGLIASLVSLASALALGRLGSGVGGLLDRIISNLNP